MNVLRRTSRTTDSRALPRGFSLLEVLLALGLSVVLIAGAFEAITLYWRMESSGRADAERTQLVRSILRTIELDIRSCAFRAAPDETEEEDTSITDGLSDDSSEDDGATEDTEAYSTRISGTSSDNPAANASGLIGTEDRILLHIIRPQPRLTSGSAGSPVAPGEPATDLLSVAYFLGDNVSIPVSEDFGVSTVSASSGTGLARLVGDQFLMQTADASGNISALGGQTRILAPEVGSIGFRYFDGIQWLGSWDSITVGRLPRAVEVTIQFRVANDDDDAPDLGISDVGPEPTTYRSVVAIPAADPQAEDSL